MISEINNQQQSNYGSSTVSTATAAAVKKEETAAEQKTNRAQPQKMTDTVEISAKGREAAQQVAPKTNVKSNTETADTTAAAAVKAEQQATAVESAETVEAASTSTPVLTSLSEQDMDKLVSDGTITQAQMSTELARRAAASQKDVEPSRKEATDSDEAEVQAKKQQPIQTEQAESSRYSRAVSAYSRMAEAPNVSTASALSLAA